MFSDEVKVGEFYHTITSGEFIGTYYVLEKKSHFNALVNYYPYNKYEIGYFDFASFDWGDDDEELPAQDWLAESEPISNLRFQRGWRGDIYDYFKSFIPHIFTKGLP